MTSHYSNRTTTTTTAGKSNIKPKSFVEILGAYTDCHLSLDKEMNKLISYLHFKLKEINNIDQYTDFENSECFGSF